MAANLRPYRLKALAMGQTSPLGLQHEMVREVVGASVADVGCGSGVTGYILRAAWQFTASWEYEQVTRADRLVGIDWSQSTIEALGKHNPYDEILLAGSTGLPLSDDAVDTAISIENLEHLLPNEVAPALAELARVSRRKIAISTPTPWTVTNTAFLTNELREARADRHPMDYEAFMTLFGWLHKSSVTPEQMSEAGFTYAVNRLGSPAVTYGAIIYTAQPERVDAAKLGPVVGLPMGEYPVAHEVDDWRERYAEAVEAIARDGHPAPTTRCPPTLVGR